MVKKAIPLSSYLDSVGFYEYLLSEKNSVSQTRIEMRNRRFSIKEEVIPARVMSHWSKIGILPDGVNTGGWRRFSLTELVWMQIVLALKNFGLSLERIAQVRKNVLDWDKNEDAYFILEFFFTKAISTELDPYVIILNNSSSILPLSYISPFLSNHKDHQDMLLISLKRIAKKMGFKPLRPETLISLSNAEWEILEQIRSGNNKEIKARLADGEISELESIENIPENPSISDIDRVLMGEKGYAEVITRYTDGKRRSAEVRRKKRVK